MVRRKKVGLLRFARNDVPLIPDTTSPSRRHAPEALMNLPPKDGVGNAGCPLHPRPRVHLVLVERTRGPHRPALLPRCAPNAAASTASLRASVTIMIRPLVGWDAQSSRSDLGDVQME